MPTTRTWARAIPGEAVLDEPDAARSDGDAGGGEPRGHLNEIDMGLGGYRILPGGSPALSCADVRIGDRVEINGRDTYRSGNVLGKGENIQDPTYDGSYFPCMIVSDVRVASGDSGGVVLVNGIPGGVTSRTFGGNLGFTPLAEGLAQLWLELCTEPDCGLHRPSAAGARQSWASPIRRPSGPRM